MDALGLGRNRAELIELIPFEAILSNDIRLPFFPGDFLTDGSISAIATRRGGPALALVGALDDDVAEVPSRDFGDSCGIRLERRRPFSLRIGPMFDRRREDFSVDPTARGVGGPRRGLAIVFRST